MEPAGGASERPFVLYLPPWRVELTERPGVARLVPRARLARAVAAAVRAGGAPAPASVGLVLSDDAELARLNATHLDAEGPTDVLSFPLLPPEAFPAHAGGEARGAFPAPSFRLPPRARPNLGDIVVSVERAVAQAGEGRGGQTGDVGWTAAEELLLLVTHGALHLCGWDHAEPEEEAAMRRLERELLGF